MRAAIYARYSSENQRETSIEDQVRRCKEYAQQCGWQVAQVDGDRAVSGAITQRPGYKTLMQAVKDCAVDVVIVDGLSRLSRDTAETMRAQKIFRYHRVGLVAITDAINILDNPKTLVQVRKAPPVGVIASSTVCERS